MVVEKKIPPSIWMLYQEPSPLVPKEIFSFNDLPATRKDPLSHIKRVQTNKRVITGIMSADDATKMDTMRFLSSPGKAKHICVSMVTQDRRTRRFINLHAKTFILCF